jgi:purine-binding chemotaxis protein CheW
VSSAQFEEPPETMTGPGATLVTGAYKLESTLLLVLDVARAAAIGIAV